MTLAFGLMLAATPALAAAPTFSKDVAPILYKNCVECHRPDAMAPMSLITYEDARPWARAIKQKVAAREMPPWGADPTIGKFSNDLSLKQSEIDTIAAWVDGGAPQGNPAESAVRAAVRRRLVDRQAGSRSSRCSSRSPCRPTAPCRTPTSRFRRTSRKTSGSEASS